MNDSSALEWVRSPQVALLANVALVMTGSVLALFALVDIVTGIILVSIGFVGIAASLLGQRETQTNE
ncbi:hypothetical protein SAMN04487967_2479 [Natronorubrum sediminis]|uniref:Uncharacterized protein n=1 Tax=Natronorubrum sediminis TaxID=640943 RepID=A0A1H6FZC8_9EURY|nr:hypothetical protein [Natronorubrum sediminis]SEH16179.1 hypothetical protein SAMN04487967_2479 [Natronorubrum sediminis]